MAAAPESDSSPASSPALVVAVVPVSFTLPRPMSTRPLLASGPTARRLACRRRALEAVEKVVTAKKGTKTKLCQRQRRSALASRNVCAAHRALAPWP
jgi:hypothetical protein